MTAEHDLLTTWLDTHAPDDVKAIWQEQQAYYARVERNLLHHMQFCDALVPYAVLPGTVVAGWGRTT